MNAIGRRGFLSFLGASPFAAKAAADQVVQDLAGISSVGSSADSMTSCAPSQAGGCNDETRLEHTRKLLRRVAFKDEVESLYFDEWRSVTRLDPDIANKRSFSVAAKVAFQRQRNVARAMEAELLDNSPYARLYRWRKTNIIDAMRGLINL